MKSKNKVLQALFHKSWIEKIKNQTGATHVSHIQGAKKGDDKVNCIWIKKGDKELKYGGKKDFSLFTPEDYENAIKEFNKL